MTSPAKSNLGKICHRSSWGELREGSERSESPIHNYHNIVCVNSQSNVLSIHKLFISPRVSESGTLGSYGLQRTRKVGVSSQQKRLGSLLNQEYLVYFAT